MEEGVYISKVRIFNVKCYGKSVELNLTNKSGDWERWTIILGNNGTGKTTILQSIALLEQTNQGFLEQENEYRPIIAFNSVYQNFLKRNNKDYYRIEIKTTLHKGQQHESDITFSWDGGIRSINEKPQYQNFKIYGYGANRFMSRNSLTESESENSKTLFDDDAKLINAEEWLLQLHLSASVKSSVKDLSVERRDLVRKTLLNILPEDGVVDIQFTEPTIENQKVTLEFKTPYGWVTIHQLSLGYKTMVAWMIDLAKRMFERYPKSPNPLAEPAIVLVDEIDLHMHPKWQRKIFDYLSEKFPKTQFIVTAHSPLIVQSAPKDANIVLLRREGDHVVIDNDIKSVHNWRIDQILNSDLFGNISQHSAETEEWMNERTILIQKRTRTESEEKRLKELNEKAHELPTADNPRDIEAMEIIREAANYLKTQNA